MSRNRALTEQRLMDAVGQIFSEDGIEGIRVNKVAKRAGVNKILIYRYFGDINGLREAYVKQSKPVITQPPLNVEALREAPLDVFFDTCCNYLLEEYRLLRQNPQAQAMLRASLLSQDDTPNPAAEEKALHNKYLVDEFSDMLGTKYGSSFTALINSGLALLTFLSQQKGTAFGFDMSKETAWSEVETTVRHLYRGAYLYTKERMEQEAQASESLPPALIEEPQGFADAPDFSKRIV